MTPDGTVPDDTGRRFRLASPATALVLGAFVLVLTAAGLPLADMAHQLRNVGVSQVVLILLFVGVGVVVAWHQPGNPIGWILLVIDHPTGATAWWGATGPGPGARRGSPRRNPPGRG